MQLARKVNTPLSDGRKVLKSTHGKILVRELQLNEASLDLILDCLEKDPLAGRFKDLDTGDNAFHLLVDGRFPHSFVLHVLPVLIEKVGLSCYDVFILLLYEYL